MALEPSFNDTVDMYFGAQSSLGQMVAEDKKDELVRLVTEAESLGVTLKFYGKKNGIVLARASTGSFFHGKSYGFINTLYYKHGADWAGYGALRELFRPSRKGYKAVSVEQAAPTEDVTLYGVS